MAEAPEPRAPNAPFHRTGKRKGRALEVQVAWTHVVQELKLKIWQTVHTGSEADCRATLDLVTRHFPDRQHRVVARAEADADERKQSWSVSDADHLPDGTRVLLARTPNEIHPSIGGVRKVFAITGADHQHRYGFVRSRHRRFGTYMVEIESDHVCKMQICVQREDIIFPIPENIIPFQPRAARKR